jgi:hypothetical protein
VPWGIGGVIDLLVAIGFRFGSSAEQALARLSGSEIAAAVPTPATVAKQCSAPSEQRSIVREKRSIVPEQSSIVPEQRSIVPEQRSSFAKRRSNSSGNHAGPSRNRAAPTALPHEGSKPFYDAITLALWLGSNQHWVHGRDGICLELIGALKQMEAI